MSRIIINVGEDRKKKMNQLTKGKNVKFKSYNELVQRLLDDDLESVQSDNSQIQDLGPYSIYFGSNNFTKRY